MSETSPFTHLTERGEAHMVDITAKTPSVRQARARGFVECSPKIMAALRDDSVPKGDALAVARIAGIQASNWLKTGWRSVRPFEPQIERALRWKL